MVTVAAPGDLKALRMLSLSGDAPCKLNSFHIVM